MKNKVGFMQGRLCEPIGGKIQSFPWRDWQAEFETATSIGLNLMEWTLDSEDLYKNPLMHSKGQSVIKKLCSQYSLSIPSITGDCFMQRPFWKCDKTSRKILQVEFLDIMKACAELGIKMVVVPLVDNGSVKSLEDENILIDFFLENQNIFDSLNISICFESDFGPDELAFFIDKFPTSNFGVNYDIGNSAANGFDPRQEFDAYGSRVLNVHVKDRKKGGTTVVLKTGDADFETVFNVLAEQNYPGNFILQTARATDGKHQEVLNKFKHLTLDWIEKNFVQNK
jgi:L-ribulose-5-phosphate 3-epimerase